MASAAGYKGWALGLLVEFLAAGLTGSVNSLDVKGLKAAEGPPHDLGQFYILIDPTAHAGMLAESVDRVASEIIDDLPVRIPGSTSKNRDPVTIDDALWASVEALAAGS